MSSSLKNIPFGKILLEMASIVFAVLVALWLDQWQEERKEQTLAAEFTSRINHEVANNYRELSDALAENTAMQDALGKLSSNRDANISLLQQMASINFAYSSPNTANAVWTSAGLTGSIPLITVSQVEDLASIYRSSDMLNDYSRHLIERLGVILATINNLDSKPNDLTELVYSFSIANQITAALLDECRAYLETWAPDLLSEIDTDAGDDESIGESDDTANN